MHTPSPRQRGGGGGARWRRMVTISNPCSSNTRLPDVPLQIVPEHGPLCVCIVPVKCCLLEVRQLIGGIHKTVRRTKQASRCCRSAILPDAEQAYACEAQYHTSGTGSSSSADWVFSVDLVERFAQWPGLDSSMCTLMVADLRSCPCQTDHRLHNRRADSLAEGKCTLVNNSPSRLVLCCAWQTNHPGWILHSRGGLCSNSSCVESSPITKERSKDAKQRAPIVRWS